jgi:hypothetical protein
VGWTVEGDVRWLCPYCGREVDTTLCLPRTDRVHPCWKCDKAVMAEKWVEDFGGEWLKVYRAKT